MHNISFLHESNIIQCHSSCSTCTYMQRKSCMAFLNACTGSIYIRIRVCMTLLMRAHAYALTYKIIFIPYHNYMIIHNYGLAIYIYIYIIHWLLYYIYIYIICPKALLHVYTAGTSDLLYISSCKCCILIGPIGYSL